ncbi:MAG TPA: tetratricopeptide repeat protein [Thermomicrobiales bacterium]
MTQQTMTAGAKPLGTDAGAAAEATTPTIGLDARPRRRLGSWQIGNADGATAAISQLPTPENGATLPLAPSSPSPTATIDLNTGDAVQPTTALPPAQSGALDSVATGHPGRGVTSTVPLSGVASAPATRQIGAPVGDAATVALAAAPTGEIAGAATAPIATATTTAELLRSIRLRGADVESVAATRPIRTPSSRGTGGLSAAAATAPIEEIGADSTVEFSAALSAEDEAQLATLRDRARDNPTDSDALFALAVALHRAGQRREARDALTKLVALYQERGQHSQAMRIMGMLAAPKTGPIATEDLPPRPATATLTAALPRHTSPLPSPSTAALGRPARLQSRLLTPQPTPQFGPESLAFTIPLPDQQRLPLEVREIVQQSSDDLKRGNLQAAFDLCLYGLNLAPDHVPLHLRIAEIYAAQRLVRRARTQAETLLRLAEASGERTHLWMVYRLLLHTTDGDLPSLRQLVELLIEAGQTEQASFYAAKLIQLLDAEGLSEEALGYSVRLCKLIPGDTRAALENAILLLKNGDRGGAVDRWEAAVAAGADPTIAKSSMAALMTSVHEDDHWRMLSEVVPLLRESGDRDIVDAYVRTAAVETPTKTLEAGEGLLLAAAGDERARELLAAAAGDRSGSAFARAVSAVTLSWLLKETAQADEYVAAVRTALQLLELPAVATHPNWQGLVGRIPRHEDLSLELGEALLARQDAAGAAEVLRAAHARSRHHGQVCDRLAEAYFRVGQLGSALTVLDELAVHYRSSGQLEAMAGVLRQMSQLAPNNIKVKSRLIDAYLQRGFVAEARAELIQRADLEERSGLIKDAVASLQRAADLSWTMGLAEETFAVYQRVIGLMPEDAGNRHALVNLYLQMGRLDEAAVHQRAVVDIAVKQDSKHEAIAALHQVIGLTPDDASAYYQLGDLLTSLGEYHQAERVYRRLVLMNPSDPIAQAKATTMAALRETAQPVT